MTHSIACGNSEHVRISIDFASHHETKATDGSALLKVYGWGSVSVGDDGTLVVDHHRDIIEPSELEAAVYDFVKSRAKLDSDHDGERRGTLIESAVFAPDKRKAMGLPEDGRTGWWSGWEVTDPTTIARVKSGELSQMSIEYSADRVVLAEDQSGTTVKGVKEIKGKADRPIGRLRKLKLHALSLVGAGAGKGVDVTYFKRKEETQMSLEELMAMISKLSPEDQAKLWANAPKEEPVVPPEDEQMKKLKEHPEFKALKEQVEKASKEAAELKERETSRKYLDKAKSLGLEFLPGATIEGHAASLRAIEEHLPKEVAEVQIKSLESAASMIKDGNILKRLGSGGNGGESDPVLKLRAIATEIKSKDPKLTDAQAFDLACAKNPEIYSAASGR